MNVKKILNYTKHDLTFVNEDGDKFVVPRTGTIRSSSFRRVVDKLHYNGHDITVSEARYGPIHGLPPPEEGTIIIISAVAASSMDDSRDDIYIIDEPLYDQNRKLIGCKSISRYNRDRRMKE